MEIVGGTASPNRTRDATGSEQDEKLDGRQNDGSTSSNDILADPEEAEHLANVLNSFHAYRRTAHYSITHTRRQAFYALPSTQWNLLATPQFGILDHLDKIDDAIDANADIAEACLSSALPVFGYAPWAPHDTKPPTWARKCNSSDQGKAYQTIRQLYRDWSTEGREERDACYEPVLRALEEEFSPPRNNTPAARRGEIRVLIPGAGLGRLLFEVVKAGYSAEGNELSYHQVIVSNHILNHIQRARQYTLYPWAFGFSNHLSRNDQLASVKVPHLHPGSELLDSSRHFEIPVAERMSMCSGDFSDIYQRSEYEGRFDAVTTVFFIDTAPNFLQYVLTVKRCLRDGGVWINLGPLLWHFEGMDSQERSIGREAGSNKNTDDIEKDARTSNHESVELTEEEVILVLEHHGFEIERHKLDAGSTGYIQNPRSMLQSVYRPTFWVARKSLAT